MTKITSFLFILAAIQPTFALKMQTESSSCDGGISSGDHVFIQAMTHDYQYVEIDTSESVHGSYDVSTRATKEASAEFIINKIDGHVGPIISGPINSGDRIFLQSASKYNGKTHYIEMSGGIKTRDWLKIVNSQAKIEKWSGESGQISSGVDSVSINFQNGYKYMIVEGTLPSGSGYGIEVGAYGRQTQCTGCNCWRGSCNQEDRNDEPSAEFKIYKWDCPGHPGLGGGKAGGDPHVQNVKGERFNIVRQGYAPLVSIASAGAAHLEVKALIEGVKKCEKKMFITQINASGNWLEQNIAVHVGDNADQKAFSVTVDGQEVWSPVVNNYKPPTDEKIIFNRADKFSIDEMSAKHTPANQPGIELKTAHDVKLKIVRPLLRPTAPPHLNFDIQGLNTLPPSFKLSGLLSQEAHSYWSTREETCGTNFAHIMTEGSIAVAH